MLLEESITEIGIFNLEKCGYEFAEKCKEQIILPESHPQICSFQKKSQELEEERVRKSLRQ